MIEGLDYIVRLIDLPCGVGGFVKSNGDGTFSIYLNARLSHAQNIESFEHEKKHIEHNDFYRGADVPTMEQEAG